MPIRSQGNAPAGAVEELGLPGRAVTVLARAGITRVEDLAVLTREELAAVKGLGAGTIAAIRAVVPEPAGGPPAGARVGRTRRAARPGSGTGAAPGEESPEAPAIPSFESLRAPGRSAAMDALVPPAPAIATPPPATPLPATPLPATPARADGAPAAGPAAAPASRPAAAPRPPEWADLWVLGGRAARAVAGAPARWACRTVRAPGRRLRRLLSR